MAAPKGPTGSCDPRQPSREQGRDNLVQAAPQGQGLPGSDCPRGQGPASGQHPPLRMALSKYLLIK